MHLHCLFLSKDSHNLRILVCKIFGLVVNIFRQISSLHWYIKDFISEDVLVDVFFIIAGTGVRITNIANKRYQPPFKCFQCTMHQMGCWGNGCTRTNFIEHSLFHAHCTNILGLFLFPLCVFSVMKEKQ